MATSRTTEQTTRPARVEDRPGQLLDIARRLFARHGYAGTSLRDIAEEAQITKAALYYHFPNKEALYQHIVLEAMQSLHERVNAAMAAASTATEKVRTFMLTSADIYAEAPDKWVAGSNAFWSGRGGVPHVEAVAERDKYENLLRTAVTAGVKSGEFRQVDTAIAGRLLLSTLNQLSRWHSPTGKLSATSVIEQYLDIILQGLQARPAAGVRPARKA